MIDCTLPKARHLTSEDDQDSQLKNGALPLGNCQISKWTWSEGRVPVTLGDDAPERVSMISFCCPIQVSNCLIVLIVFFYYHCLVFSWGFLFWSCWWGSCSYMMVNILSDIGVCCVWPLVKKRVWHWLNREVGHFANSGRSPPHVCCFLLISLSVQSPLQCSSHSSHLGCQTNN